MYGIPARVLLSAREYHNWLPMPATCCPMISLLHFRGRCLVFGMTWSETFTKYHWCPKEFDLNTQHIPKSKWASIVYEMGTKKAGKFRTRGKLKNVLITACGPGSWRCRGRRGGLFNDEALALALALLGKKRVVFGGSGLFGCGWVKHALW